MGMFDTYIIKEKECPGCGSPITEFQSKEAGCNLDTFKEGQGTERICGNMVTEIANSNFIIYGLCRYCRKNIETDAYFKNGRFVGITKLRIREYI